MIFDSLYYTLYKVFSINEHTWGNAGGLHYWNAMLFVSLVEMFNVMTLFILINQITKFQISFEKIHGIITIVVFFGGNYFIYIKDRRYKRIVEKFDSKSKRYRYILNTLTVLYMLFSIIILFVVLETFKTDDV